MKKIILIILSIITPLSADYLIRRITNDSMFAEDNYPSWSPDGTKIAYEKKTNDKYDIWIITISNGATTRLTFSTNDNRFPRWSFDGTKITFTKCNGSNYTIYTINILNSNETYIADGIYPNWSPDSNYIVFDRIINDNWILIKKNLISGEEFQLTNEPGINIGPDWSHDGTKIVYNFGDYLPTILTIPSGGGSPTQLPIYYGYYPNWHPDGTKICFIGGSITGNYVIWVYDLLKDKLTQITPAVEPGPDSWSDSTPEWSFDGTKIAFSRTDGNIYIVDLTQQQKVLVSVGKIKAYFK